MLICLSDTNDHVRSTSVASLAPHALHSPEVVAGNRGGGMGGGGGEGEGERFNTYRPPSALGVK
jgi:hypothetical protein